MIYCFLCCSSSPCHYFVLFHLFFFFKLSFLRKMEKERSLITSLEQIKEQLPSHLPFEALPAELLECLKRSPIRLTKAVVMVLTGNRKYVNGNQKPTFFMYPDIKNQPWWDAASYDYTNKLSQNYSTILAEYKSLKASKQWEVITSSNTNGEWGAFNLYAEGKKKEENCALAPQTTKIIESIPEFMSGCGLCYAYFSSLKPGTWITPHFGPANIRLRVHLGLEIPEDPTSPEVEPCVMVVANEARKWKDGECMLFDDSYLHEVRFPDEKANRSRVILLVDVWHPDLTPNEIEALKTFFKVKFKD